MQLHGALEEQEHAPGHEDEITPGEGLARQGEDGFGKAHDPGDGRQQHKAHDQGKAEAGEEGMPPLPFGQALGKDGNKNKVVDAQDHFQQDQRPQTGPGRRIGDPRHIPHSAC